MGAMEVLEPIHHLPSVASQQGVAVMGGRVAPGDAAATEALAEMEACLFLLAQKSPSMHGLSYSRPMSRPATEGPVGLGASPANPGRVAWRAVRHPIAALLQESPVRLGPLAIAVQLGTRARMEPREPMPSSNWLTTNLRL